MGLLSRIGSAMRPRALKATGMAADLRAMGPRPAMPPAMAPEAESLLMRAQQELAELQSRSAQLAPRERQRLMELEMFVRQIEGGALS